LKHIRSSPLGLTRVGPLSFARVVSQPNRAGLSPHCKAAMRPSSGQMLAPSGSSSGRARSGSGGGMVPSGAPPVAPKHAAWTTQPVSQPIYVQPQQMYPQYAGVHQPLQPQVAREWVASAVSGGGGGGSSSMDAWRATASVSVSGGGGSSTSTTPGARTPVNYRPGQVGQAQAQGQGPALYSQPIQSSSSFSPNARVSGGVFDFDQPLPPPQMQPRPPGQAPHPPRQAFGPPGVSGGAPVPPVRSGAGQQPLNGAPSSARSSGTMLSPTPPVGSLQDKVAAALQELESIKKSDYRPNTAGGPSSRGRGNFNFYGEDGLSSGATTPLPRTPGGVRPPSSLGLGPSASAAMAARDPSAAADARLSEELRTAKSIVKKLYKRNVKLMAEVKALRAANPTADAAVAASAAQDFEPNERALIDQNAAASGGQGDQSSGDECEGGQSGLVSRHSNEEPEDSGRALSSSPSLAVPAGGGRSRFNSNASRAPPRGSAGSSPVFGSAQSHNSGVGGSSHLLFLLGERDTTLNKQQSLINTLQRKLHALQAKLELQQQHAHGRGDAATAGSSPSGKRGGAELDGSAAAPAAEDDPLSAALSDFAATQLEQLQSQLLTLRASLASRLRSQMQQLSLSLTQSGEPLPSGRVRAYIADLERWLIWESSWRGVEKSALNAQLLRAEKQAQDQWVRARILEQELHELQTRIHHMDAQTRNVDTQLAAALERNKVLETENRRLKR